MSEMIPWWQPQLVGGEDAAVAEVLRTCYLNDGDVTAAFERRIAELFEARHAIATTSGTTAIFLAVAAAGAGPGDEVIVPDVTFIATANAVRLAGATPVLVDIDERTLNIDPAEVEAAITPATKAIVPVHVSGRSADMNALMTISRRSKIPLIEDAAEALMSRSALGPLGTIGTAGCLSFSPNKTITTGQGGMVLTNDDAFAARLRALKDHGRPQRGTGGNDLHPTLGFNFKLTNLQAAVGLAQSAALVARADRLRQVFRLYRDGLTGIAGVRLPGFDVDNGETPQWIDAVVDDRNALIEHLKAHGIDSRPFWYPLHTQQPYRRPDSQFPRSTRLMPASVWLPSAPALTDAQVARVCDTIRAFYARR